MTTASSPTTTGSRTRPNLHGCRDRLRDRPARRSWNVAAGDGVAPGRGGRLPDARRAGRAAGRIRHRPPLLLALARSSGCRSTERVPGPPADGLPGPRRRPEPAPAGAPSTSADRRMFEWLPGALDAVATLTRSRLPADRDLEPGRDRPRRDDRRRPGGGRGSDARGRRGRRRPDRRRFIYCPHGWDEGCECRKPRPGLLFQAQREYRSRPDADAVHRRRRARRAGGRGSPAAPFISSRRLHARSAARHRQILIAGGSIRHHDTATCAFSITGHEGYIGSVMAPLFADAGSRCRRPRHRLLPRLHARAAATGHPDDRQGHPRPHRRTTSAASMPSSTSRP